MSLRYRALIDTPAERYGELSSRCWPTLTEQREALSALHAGRRETGLAILSGQQVYRGFADYAESFHNCDVDTWRKAYRK